MAPRPRNRVAKRRLSKRSTRSARQQTPAVPPTPRRLQNLPTQLTTFIGREGEIAEVKRLLGATRLLTLTGSGGCGKTRLAFRVAEDLIEQYPDGVWVAELAALAGPSLVPKAVATALDVPEQPGRSMTAALKQSLRDKSLLLVLDNCEHLVSACAELANDLLTVCPQIRILATSRERLGVAGETIWRVPSLSVPEVIRRFSASEELVPYDAVRLFVDRAVASLPGFALTPENACSVAQICRRLDGIPLAIELAAARVRVLSVEQIAAWLDDRFRLLTEGARTAALRQQTLRATMDWSFDLLSEEERALLRRLSVFAGGWSLEAAESVCSGNGVELPDILRLLTQLVDKSLVLVDAQHGEARYRFLETVREYGHDRLLETREAPEAQRRHRDWCLRLVETAQSHIPGGREEDLWVKRLEREHDNLRTALEWSLTVGDSDAALRLAGGLGTFWYICGYYNEGMKWLDRALSSEGHGSPAVRRKALATTGWLAVVLGQRQRAAELFQKALALAQDAGDKKIVGRGLNALAHLALIQGELERSKALLLEGLTLFREVGDTYGIADAVNGLGEVARSQGEYEGARVFYQDSVAMQREMGDKRGIAIGMVNLGFVVLHQGDCRAGASFFHEALGLNRTVGHKKGITTSVTGLAGVALAEGQPKRAARLLGASEAMLEALGGHFDATDQADYDRFVVSTRSRLEKAAFEEAWAEGRAMTLEQAIEYGLTSPGAEKPAGQQPTKRQDGDRLTAREREIARLIARGLTNREIATTLVIAGRTADAHVQNILNKLGFHSRAQVAAWAVERGLRDTDPEGATPHARPPQSRRTP